MATTDQFYTGDGVTTLFTFPFEYITKDDVKVSLDDVNTTAYTYANATTIQMNVAPAVGVQLRIFRETNIDDLKATFFAGSAIRATDLNDNFQQNNFAVEEIRNYTWDNEVDTIHSDEPWESSDTKIATTQAMDQRFQDEAQETIESTETWISDDDHIATTRAIDQRFQDELDETIESTEIWVNDDDHIATTQAIENRFWNKPEETVYGVDPWVNSDVKIPTTQSVDQRIDYSIDNDFSVTDGLTYSSTNGQATIGIAANSVDLDRIKDDDILTYAEEIAGSPSWLADGRIPTTHAASQRFDTLVQTTIPTGSSWPVGKTWLQNDSDKTVSIWNGSAWLPVASGGAFTTQPTVIYVDATNGDDASQGHRISNPKKTIKNAVASANAGDLIIVNPGVYQETCPIDITVANLSIVGSALRSVFVHPTQATETQSMFRVNSGTYIADMTLSGVKASGTAGGNSVDPGSTYGLPTNQGWVASFYPGAVITKSPYIYNCTNFSDSAIDNTAFNPNNLGGGFAGDLTSSPTGGGILVDGSVVATNSPLRSMVTDSFTQVGLNGPGILVTNNGYAQCTSSYAFFTRYHVKALNGGQVNLSASTSDFGNYGLIADGRSPNPVFTANTTALASAGSLTFTIDTPIAANDWFGSATRPANNMLVDVVDSNGTSTYPVISSVANGSGWTVTISNPNPLDLSDNQGLAYDVANNASVSFYLRSMVASSGHTMEYVGSGTDYSALPENGGVPDETKQVTELNNGRVWVVSVDHKGTLKAGNTFKVNQESGFVTIPSGAIKFTNYVQQSSDTGSASLPTGTSAERDVSPSAGFIRFNTDTGGFEGYDGSAWGGLGGGAGGGAEFITTPQIFTVSKSIAADTNAGMMGPTVTIHSSATISVGANSILTVFK